MLKGIRDALDAGAGLYARNQAAELTDEEMRTIEASRAATTPTLAWLRRAREAGSSTARDLAARTARRATWAVCQWIAGVLNDGTSGPVSGFERMRAWWPEPIASRRVLDGQREEVARLLKMPALTPEVEEAILSVLGFRAITDPGGPRVRWPEVSKRLTDIQSCVRELAALLLFDPNADGDWRDPKAVATWVLCQWIAGVSDDGLWPLTLGRVEADRALLKLSRAADTIETPVQGRPTMFTLSGGHELLRDARRVLEALDAAADRALTDPDIAPPPARRARPTTRASLRHCILSLARIYEAQRKGERADAKLSGDFLSLCRVLRLHELMPRERSGSERTQMDALRKQVSRALAGRDEDAPRLRAALARPRSTLRRRR